MTQKATAPPLNLEALSDKEKKLDLSRCSNEVQEWLVKSAIDDEVSELCGKRHYNDNPEKGRYKRWGSNPGSIRVGGERVPIRVPRVRDTETGRERPLEAYRKLRRSSEEDQDRLAQNILLGLGRRNYHWVVRTFVESRGLSASSVSRTFKKRSHKALEAFEQRDLSADTYVALQIDGKCLKKHHIVLCLGITAEGKKKLLGVIQTKTENAEAVTGLLQNLIKRGLRFDQGLLCAIDGAKGLVKAVRDVFGSHAQIQRYT